MASSVNYAIAFLAVVCIQGLDAARIVRSTDASTPLQELASNAMTQLQGFNEEWNRLLSSSNLEQMTPILMNKTAELRSRVESLSGELRAQSEAHGSQMSERTSAAIADAISRLNASIEQLQAQAPAAAEGADALRQRFDHDFKSTAETLFQELGKVAKASSQEASDAQQQLNQLSRTAMDRAMSMIQQLQNQFQQSVQRTSS